MAFTTDNAWQFTLPGINPWLAVDLDIFSQSLGEKVDGVLGAEVFSQLSWAVDNHSHESAAWRHSPSLMGYQQCLPYEDQFGRSPVLTLDYKAYSISMVVDTGVVQSFVSEGLIGRMKKQYCNVTTGYRQTLSDTASGLGHDNDYLIDGLTFYGMPVGRMKISDNKNDMYNLGMDFFSRFDSYLFAPDQMLFCHNARHFTRNEMIKRPCATLVSASTSSEWKFSITIRSSLPVMSCKMAICCGKSTADAGCDKRHPPGTGGHAGR